MMRRSCLQLGDICAAAVATPGWEDTAAAYQTGQEAYDHRFTQHGCDRTPKWWVGGWPGFQA